MTRRKKYVGKDGRALKLDLAFFQRAEKERDALRSARDTGNAGAGAQTRKKSADPGARSHIRKSA